ncbi:hypothetical protein [Micromonospora echinaurantiaca]|uniref:hypothetical protein n=1 Tax=Micromonospora echinaurantiaca TaxID=47857 RepID=UPI0037B6F600
MTLEWRRRLLPGAGLLVLASSFLPWWMVRVRHMTEHETTYETFFGSAWGMSSRWSAAVLLTLGAIVVAMIWRHAQGRMPSLAHVATLAAVALSVFLVVQQWRDVEAWPPAGSWSQSRVEPSDSPWFPEPSRRDMAAEIAGGFMERDNLRSHHAPGLTAGVGWGMWVGLCAIVLAGAALIVANSRSRPSS